MARSQAALGTKRDCLNGRLSNFDYTGWLPFKSDNPHPQNTTGFAVASKARDCNGEPVGIRTRDLLIKSQLLYQLSYRPTIVAVIRKFAL